MWAENRCSFDAQSFVDHKCVEEAEREPPRLQRVLHSRDYAVERAFLGTETNT